MKTAINNTEMESLAQWIARTIVEQEAEGFMASVAVFQGTPISAPELREFKARVHYLVDSNEAKHD